jgi:hypothetical protein
LEKQKVCGKRMAARHGSLRTLTITLPNIIHGSKEHFNPSTRLGIKCGSPWLSRIISL